MVALWAAELQALLTQTKEIEKKALLKARISQTKLLTHHYLVLTPCIIKKEKKSVPRLLKIGLCQCSLFKKKKFMSM